MESSYYPGDKLYKVKKTLLITGVVMSSWQINSKFNFGTKMGNCFNETDLTKKKVNG